MNLFIENSESPALDETRSLPPHEAAAGDPPPRAASAAEMFSVENENRRIYRRSVAYFFFGFGSQKHSIVTDDSAADQT